MTYNACLRLLRKRKQELQQIWQQPLLRCLPQQMTQQQIALLKVWPQLQSPLQLLQPRLLLLAQRALSKMLLTEPLRCTHSAGAQHSMMSEL